MFKAVMFSNAKVKVEINTEPTAFLKPVAADVQRRSED